MNRVIRDHLESGYIRKVEYRAIKEPDQEIDYLIRYYPGLAAGESIDRIQTHIRKRRTPQRLAGRSPFKNDKQDNEGSVALEVPAQPTALSVVTAQDIQLMTQLLFQFGITLSKSYELTLTQKDSVALQLEVWPLRNIKPRNRAGWMIHAIEKRYEVRTPMLKTSAGSHACFPRPTGQRFALALCAMMTAFAG
jgi:hypothetical protein